MDNKYYQAIVTYIDNQKMKISYEIKCQDKLEEIFLPLNTNKIFEIGKFTGKNKKEFADTKQINDYLHKKKLFKSTNNQEFNFKEELKKIQMKIVDIKEDGNCLYRSISHQIYGNEDYYKIIKKFCMEYLDIEKEFFGQFINGGIGKFSEYLELKRKDGNFLFIFLLIFLFFLIVVWGDDIEIQAISELYDRPIEIYAYSIEPLKTFHENKDFNRLGNKNENNNNNFGKKYGKINISYHGNCHYNSLIPENEELFYKDILRSTAGDFEELAIERLKRIKENKIAISEKVNNNENIIDNNNIDINKNQNKSSKIKNFF